MSLTITIIIIAITVIISLRALSNPMMLQKWMMNPYMVFHRKQYWRLISSGFIHGSFIHLGFNMFTFYFFGRAVENVFGELLGPSSTVVYVLFYLSAIIVSDLPGAWKRKDQINYNSLGASGAVSAMVFASILYFPLRNIYLFAAIPIPGFILGIVYVLYSYFQGKNMSDNINHEAHLYGAVYGVVFAIIMYPPAAVEFIRQISTFSFF